MIEKRVLTAEESRGYYIDSTEPLQVSFKVPIDSSVADQLSFRIDPEDNFATKIAGRIVEIDSV